jgi:hypothetical protein
MKAPKREHIVTVACHRIEELDPELALPHHGDVRLRGVGTVRIARRAQIERDVELDATPRDVRRGRSPSAKTECLSAGSKTAH